jgi:hypothetical protein
MLSPLPNRGALNKSQPICHADSDSIFWTEERQMPEVLWTYTFKKLCAQVVKVSY